MAQTRPRTPHELTEHVHRHARRLDRGIAAIDSGDMDGLDDVVTALRALVTQGNQLLQQLARAFDISIVPGPVTSPVPSDGAITFAMGASPMSDGAGSESDMPRSLSKLMAMRCLRVRTDTDEVVDHTWDSFIRDFANKLGFVHSDANVPVALDELATYGITDIDAAAYALRNFGVLVRRCCADVLVAAGVQGTQPTHAIPAPGRVWVGDVQVRGRIYETTFNPALARGVAPLASWPAVEISASAAANPTRPVGTTRVPAALAPSTRSATEGPEHPTRRGLRQRRRRRGDVRTHGPLAFRYRRLKDEPLAQPSAR